MYSAGQKISKKSTNFTVLDNKKKKKSVKILQCWIIKNQQILQCWTIKKISKNVHLILKSRI
jgi:hypothetical protein